MTLEDSLARTDDPLADPLADPPAGPPAAEPPPLDEPNEPAAAPEPAPAEEQPPAADPEPPAEEPAPPAPDPGTEWDTPEVEVPGADPEPAADPEPPAAEPAPAEDSPPAEPDPEPAAAPAPAEEPPPAAEPDPPADPPEAAADGNGRKEKGSSVRPYALLEGRRLREIVAEVVDQAGGTLTVETLEKLIATDTERFRERLFRPLDQVEAVNKTNAVRALHKRESGQGKQRVHLAIFPAHYWTPETMLVGTETTVSVETVDDDD